MPNLPDIAITSTKIKSSQSVSAIQKSLEHLLRFYDFGFRSYGGVIQLLFEDEEFIQESEIEEKISSASSIDSVLIKHLVDKYNWFCIGGSIRLQENDQLIDLDLLLYPTFSSEYSACIVFRIDGKLYKNIGKNENRFNEKDAAVLAQLTISLGTNEIVSGFQATLITELDDIQTFDSQDLEQSILSPISVQKMASGKYLRLGFVIGIKNSNASQIEIENIWHPCQIFRTTNNFTVLNRLVRLEA